MSKKEVKKIRASNALAQKIGAGDVDSKKIAAAQDVMEATEIDFGEIANPFLEKLQAAVVAAQAREGDADGKALIESITNPTMNLKANAATFNYPLVSEAAGTVLNFLDMLQTIDDDIVVIADNLHKAITVIVSQKMSGADNPIGKTLVKEFKDVCQRYVDKHISS